MMYNCCMYFVHLYLTCEAEGVTLSRIKLNIAVYNELSLTPLAATIMASEDPLYNIGVVARMTGIPVGTLRVWERRYAFPATARTPGGHRLYSEKEVMRLRWVKARIDEGMQTGQAIRALHHAEVEGRLLETSPLMPPATPPRETVASLVAFHERLVKAMLAHDLTRADQVLGEALALFPVEDLVFHVLVPALEEIGEAYLDERISIATEHLATNYVRHRVLMWMLTGPPPHPVTPTVLACAPGELHEGSLLILGTLLRRQGWPVAYLGQSLPLPDLGAFVKEINPPAVVLVAMTEEAARALREWPRWLPKAAETGRPVVGYGGYIFTVSPGWREQTPGVYLGDTLQEGLDNLTRILRDSVGLLPEL